MAATHGCRKSASFPKTIYECSNSVTFMEQEENNSTAFEQAYDTLTNREFKNSHPRKERRGRCRKKLTYAETYREIITNDRDLCLTAGKTTVKFTQKRRACSPQNLRSIAKKIASSLFAGPITSQLKKDVGLKNRTVSFDYDSEPKKRKVTFEDRSNSPINYISAPIPDSSRDTVTNTSASVLEENSLNRKDEKLKVEHQSDRNISASQLETKTFSENDSSSFFSKASAFADIVFLNGIFSSSLEKPNIIDSTSTSVDINLEGPFLDNTQLVDNNDDASKMDTIKTIDTNVIDSTFEKSHHVDKGAETSTVIDTQFTVVKASKPSDEHAADSSTSFHSTADVSFPIQAKIFTASKTAVGFISDHADASTSFDVLDTAKAVEKITFSDSINMSEDEKRMITATNGKDCRENTSEISGRKTGGTESPYFSAMTDVYPNMHTSPSDAFRFQNWSNDDNDISLINETPTSQYVTPHSRFNKHSHKKSANITFTKTSSNKEPLMLFPAYKTRGYETPIKRNTKNPKASEPETSKLFNASKKDITPVSNTQSVDRSNRTIKQTEIKVTQIAKPPIENSALTRKDVSIKKSDIAFEGYDSSGNDSIMGVASYPLTATQNSVVCKEIRDSEIKKITKVSKIASEGNNTKKVSLREITKNQMLVLTESSTDDYDTEHTLVNNAQHSISQETTEYMELNLIGSIESYAQEFANGTSEDSITPYEMQKIIKTIPNKEPTCKYSNINKSPKGNICIHNPKNNVKEEQEVVYLRSSQPLKGTGFKEASTTISKCYLESCPVTLTTEASTSITKAYVTCDESIGSNATENKEDVNTFSEGTSNSSSKQSKYISTSTSVSKHESDTHEKQIETGKERIKTPICVVDESNTSDSEPIKEKSRRNDRRNRNKVHSVVYEDLVPVSKSCKGHPRENYKRNRETLPSIAEREPYKKNRQTLPSVGEREIEGCYEETLPPVANRDIKKRNKEMLPSVADRKTNKRTRDIIATIINVARTSDSSMDESNKTYSDHRDSREKSNTINVPSISWDRENNKENELNQGSELNEEIELNEESECKQKYNVKPGEMIGYKRLKKIVNNVDETTCLEDTIEELTSSRVVMFDLKRLIDEELQLTGCDGESIVQTIGKRSNAANVQTADSKLSVSSKCSDLAHVIDTYISYASVVSKKQQERNHSDYLYTNDMLHHTHTIYPTKSASSVDFSDDNRMFSEYRYSRQHNLSKQKSLDNIQTPSFNTDYGSLTDLKASNIWKNNMRYLVNPKERYTSRRNRTMDLSAADTISNTLSSVSRDIHIVKKILANKCNSNERLYTSNKKRSKSCCYQNHMHGDTSPKNTQGKITKRTAVHHTDSVELQLYKDSRKQNQQPKATASSAPTYRREHNRYLKSEHQNSFETFLDSFLTCEEEPSFVQNCVKGVTHRQARSRAREACVGTSAVCLCISPSRTLGAHARRGDHNIVCNNPNECIDVCLCDGSEKDLKSFYPFTKPIHDSATTNSVQENRKLTSGAQLYNHVADTIDHIPKEDYPDEMINTRDLQEVIQELESSTEAITNNMQQFLQKDKVRIEIADQCTSDTASRQNQSHYGDNSDAKISIRDLQLFVRHFEAKTGFTKPTNHATLAKNICDDSVHANVNVTNGTSTHITKLQSYPKEEARYMDSMKPKKTRQQRDDVYGKHNGADIYHQECRIDKSAKEDSSDYTIRVGDLQNFISEYESSSLTDTSSKYDMESKSVSEEKTICDIIPMTGHISEVEVTAKNCKFIHCSQLSSSAKGHLSSELTSTKNKQSETERASLSSHVTTRKSDQEKNNENNKPCHQQDKSQTGHSQTGVREKESVQSCTKELRQFIEEFECEAENDVSSRVKMIPEDIQHLLRSILTNNTISNCESTPKSKQLEIGDEECSMAETLVNSFKSEEINTKTISHNRTLSNQHNKAKFHEKDIIQSSMQDNPKKLSETYACKTDNYTTHEKVNVTNGSSTHICDLPAHEKVNVTNGSSTHLEKLQLFSKDDARYMDNMKQNKTRQQEDNVHGKHNGAHINKKEYRKDKSTKGDASDHTISIRDLQNFINEFECSTLNDEISTLQTDMKSNSVSGKKPVYCDTIQMSGHISEREVFVKNDKLKQCSQHSSSVKGHLSNELKSTKSQKSKTEKSPLSPHVTNRKSDKDKDNKNKTPCHKQDNLQAGHSQTLIREKEGVQSCTKKLRKCLEELENQSENDLSSKMNMIPNDIQNLLRSILTNNTSSKCESAPKSKQHEVRDEECSMTDYHVKSLQSEEINKETISKNIKLTHRKHKAKVHEKDIIKSSLPDNPKVLSEKYACKTYNDTSSIKSRIPKDIHNSLQSSLASSTNKDNKSTPNSHKQDDTEVTLSITENDTQSFTTDSERCEDQIQTDLNAETGYFNLESEPSSITDDASNGSSHKNNKDTKLRLNAETGYFTKLRLNAETGNFNLESEPSSITDNDSHVSSHKKNADTKLRSNAETGCFNSESTPPSTSERTNKESIMSSLLKHMSKTGTMIVLNSETGYVNSSLHSTLSRNPNGHSVALDEARSKQITHDVSESSHQMEKETLFDLDTPSWSKSDPAGTLQDVSEQSNKPTNIADISKEASTGIINTEELRKYMKELERKHDTDRSSMGSIKKDVEALIRSTLTSTIRSEYESMLRSSKMSETEVTYTIAENSMTSSKTSITNYGEQCQILSACPSDKNKTVLVPSNHPRMDAQNDSQIRIENVSEQTDLNVTNTFMNTKSNTLQVGDNIVQDKDTEIEENVCVQKETVSKVNNMEDMANSENTDVSYYVLPSSEQVIESPLSLKGNTCADLLSISGHPNGALLSSQCDSCTTTVPLLDAETSSCNTPFLSTHGMNTYGHSTTLEGVETKQISQCDSELSNKTGKETLCGINSESASISDYSQTMKNGEESDLPSQSTDDEKCIESNMSEQSNRTRTSKASIVSGQSHQAIPNRQSKLKSDIGLSRLSRKLTLTDSHGTDSFHRQWVESCVDNHSHGQGVESCSCQCIESCGDTSNDCKCGESCVDGCTVEYLGSSVDIIRCSKLPEGLFANEVNDTINTSTAHSLTQCTDSCVDTGLQQCIESCVDSICSMVIGASCTSNTELSQESLTNDKTCIATPLLGEMLDDLKAASDIEKRICQMAQVMVRRKLSLRSVISESTVAVREENRSHTKIHHSVCVSADMSNSVTKSSLSKGIKNMGLEPKLDHNSEEPKEKPAPPTSKAILLGSSTDESINSWPNSSLVELCAPFIQSETSLLYQKSTEANSIVNRSIDTLVTIQSKSQNVTCGLKAETNISTTVTGNSVTSKLQNKYNKPLDDGPQALDKHIKFVVENKKKEIIEQILRELHNSNTDIDEYVPNGNITNQNLESNKQMRKGVASLQTIQHPGVNIGVQEFKHSSQIIVILPDSPVDPYPIGVNGSGEFCCNKKETQDTTEKSDLHKTLNSTRKLLNENRAVDKRPTNNASGTSVDMFNEHVFDDEETHNSGANNASTFYRSSEIYLNEIKCDDCPSNATSIGSNPNECASDTSIVDGRVDGSSSDVTIIEKQWNFEEKPTALASKKVEAGYGGDDIPLRDMTDCHEESSKGENNDWGMIYRNTGKYVVRKIGTKNITVPLETDIKSITKSDFVSTLVPPKRQMSPQRISKHHVNPKDIKTIACKTRMTGNELTPAGLARNIKSVFKQTNCKTNVAMNKASLAEVEKEKRAVLRKKLEKFWKKSPNTEKTMQRKPL